MARIALASKEKLVWLPAGAPRISRKVMRRCHAVRREPAPRGARCARLRATPRPERVWAKLLSGLLAFAASAAVLAVSSAQEELTAVKRSVPNLDRGAQHFETCAACHGPDGGGTRDGQVPRIGGQHVSVVEKQLLDYRHDRRWDLRMEHFADDHHLGDTQAVADVAAYIRQLEPSGPAGQGSGRNVNAGAALYAKRCGIGELAARKQH